MKTFDKTPIQFHTNDGIGLRLANAATRKRLDLGRRAMKAAFPGPPIPTRALLTGAVSKDIVTLASAALIARLQHLLHQDPLKIIQEDACRMRIRVCGALDYVIDRTQHRVWAEPAPLTRAENFAKQRPPWCLPCRQALDNIDLLNPLNKPMWLAYVAARPGWFGYAFARHHGSQRQLFIEYDEMADALGQVLQHVWRQICNDQAVVALRHQLATALTLHVGPGVVSLAMRARLRTTPSTLDARHLARVWKHRPMYENMARENPKLLPALTAWLLHEEPDQRGQPPQVADAVPAMRRDLLASGLPPRARRFLAQHGMKRLLPDQMFYDPWESLLEALRALDAARWPALPPRGFLRLLNDVAGRPQSYEEPGAGVPGWFWQMTCDAAHACKGDTAEYSDLFDCIPAWAWMVRHYQLKPDKNQRRKGKEWLEFMSDVVQSMALEKDVPEWALWLPPDGWDDSHKHKIVPLQSREALLRESIALHNCADALADRCRAESRILISLRLWATDKPVALACVERRGCNWVLGQVAGPCNQPVRPWVQQLAQEAAAWVRYHHSQRPSVPVQPQADDDINDAHILFEDP